MSHRVREWVVSIQYRIGDVFDELAKIEDASIDLIVTSPPFLALRSYLPADHPDKHKEIGSEPTPAEFIDTLLALTAEWGRVLAPHGSLCVELGDTFAASKSGTNTDRYRGYSGGRHDHNTAGSDGGIGMGGGAGWPLAKSLTGIPTLYPWSLAYGRNLLTGQESPAGQWRIRNIVVWARPNPPVGALGDKWRPATSYITVACRGAKRYFDLDAVRTGHVVKPEDRRVQARSAAIPSQRAGVGERTDGKASGDGFVNAGNPAGAPPLDWHADNHPEDGDWLWKLSTQPYKGSHYATYPLTLPKRLIEAMCPLRVCVECGKPSERIVGDAQYVRHDHRGLTVKSIDDAPAKFGTQRDDKKVKPQQDALGHVTKVVETFGWTDCGHNATRMKAGESTAWRLAASSSRRWPAT